MSECTKEKALEVAIKYLGEQCRGRIEIEDGLSDEYKHYVYGYENLRLDKCWVVYVPPDTPEIGASRYICISKATCEIVFDGKVGE